MLFDDYQARMDGIAASRFSDETLMLRFADAPFEFDDEIRLSARDARDIETATEMMEELGYDC